jgi:prepilin-type N-terminal cleavage/methylation domain-containing protein
MQKQKGFTIIELIVVIAIIAVLASIVLVNVTSYINKGKDVSMQGNMANLVTNYAVFADVGGTTGAAYLAQAGATGGKNFVDAMVTAGYTLAPNNSGAAWCECSIMKADATKTFCVDSTGAKITKTGSVACATECPASAVCQ